MVERDRDRGDSQVISNRVTRPGIFRPRWDGPCEKFAKAYVASNLWRVRHLLTYDEAVQECAVIFARCCRLYEGKVDNPKWFMALFTRGIKNDFHTLARKNTKLIAGDSAAKKLHDRNAVEASEGPLYSALCHGSDELRQVFAVMAAAPQELLRLMLGFPRRDEGAWSRGLCRLARTPRVRSDLISELRLLLQ
jgi:hypothetical protein